MASYRDDFGRASNAKVFLACGPLNPANLVVFAYLLNGDGIEGLLSLIGLTLFFFTFPASLAILLFISPWSRTWQRPPGEESLWPLVGCATMAAFLYALAVSAMLSFAFTPLAFLFGVPIGLVIAILPGGLFVLSARILIGWLDARQRMRAVNSEESLH